ncbi:metal-dependent transcriptional regulator [Kineosporia sp. J2-2]|uniref:Metal-dependent transcriptional regulator n=1 Tax=Kineosporia corallincola TaxID=2835133 RepID=A0ABS5TDC8_9ACTN|nr:metal-dependent transcriptional regulator [Kineosporia corallincola]MBT0769060.1 metal-dependent transcriptional regulator [Kineosporia corallincola]
MNDHDLVDTGEMYLKAVLELEEEGVVPLRARLVERFDQSGPTVSQTVDRLRRNNLLDLGGDRQLVLTESGRATAGNVMRKHRLTEVFLHQVVGLEWPLLHTEACRWEHVISDHTESLVAQLLGHPRYSPYGNPIEAGVSAGTENLVRHDGHEPIRIAWIGEPLQADPSALQELMDQGLTPGATVTVTERHTSGVTLVNAEDAGVRLSGQVARHIFVAPVGADLSGIPGAGEPRTLAAQV